MTAFTGTVVEEAAPEWFVGFGYVVLGGAQPTAWADRVVVLEQLLPGDVEPELMAPRLLEARPHAVLDVGRLSRHGAGPPQSRPFSAHLAREQ